jgi:hypothetical protein
MHHSNYLRNIFLLIGFTLSLNFAVAQNQSHACYYQIELTDDYDDGWNGAEVEIIDSVGNVIYTLGKNFTDGAIFMHNVLLNSGLTYSLVVSDEGNYPEEIGLVIKSNGVIVSTYNSSFSTSLNTQMASLSPTCVNCLSSQMCSFNVTLTDSYGDGWDGARAEIRDTNGNIFYVLGVNFSTGSTYTDSVVLCSSNQYKIVLTDEGDYPQEIGLSVSDGLSFVSSYSPSSNTSTGAELASFTAACISGNVDAITSCGPYTWTNGLTYSTSNFSAVDTLTNVNGQDSIVTLNLVVNSPQYRADSVVSFSSYTWIDGNTYSQSTSVPSMTFTDSNGCDSIVNLVLSIRSPGVVSREIMFMPDEPKDILTSKPQYPDSTWANTRIFNIDRLIDAYTHYPDDDSTIVGTGLYRVINATPREYYNVVVWGIFQNTTDTVFIRDFSLLRSFESIILELPYVAGTGQKTFTTINGGSVTISNPFNKDIDFYLECSDESFNKLREIEMSTRLWFLDNQKTTGNFDDPTPAFCRHFLTAYANIAYMWSQAEFEDSWQDVDMIIHGNQSWHGFIKKSNGTYLKTSLITTNSDSLTLTGDSTSGLPNTSWLMYEEISMDTIFKSNGDTLINDKWFLGTNTTVLDSFPNSELYKLLPVSDTLNKLSILNTFKAKSDQYLGNIKNVSGLGGGSLLGIAGGQIIGQRFYESIGQSNSTFYHEFAHGINYHHSSNLTYADARGGWELFNRKMFEGYSGSRDTVDLTFKNGQPRVITKTLPFIEPFYRQDVFHTDSVNISSEFGVDTILDIKIINLHEWLYTTTAISSRYSRNDTKKPDLVIDSLSLPYGVTTSQVFPLIIPIGDTADVSIRLKLTNLSTTDTSVTKDSIVIHGEHTHWIPLEVELIPLNYSSIDTVKECDNYYWGVNNETYESSNIVIEELTDSQGQDSILILSLEINQSYSDTIHQLSYCTPFYWQGDTIFASGLYSSSFISEHGCDSTLYLDFTRIDGIDSSFVSANNDDAKEFQNNGSMNLGSKALQLGGTSGKLLKSGFRFSDVGLEKGTNIQSARVSMVARSNDSSPLKITIAGVALDSTSSFSNTSYHLSSLPQTNEKVEWTLDNWTQDSTYYTADVSSIITEITNRPNWKAGNALTLIMWPTDSSTSNQRTLRSKNDGSIIGLYVNYGNPIEIVDTVATSYFWHVSQSSYSTSGVYVFVPTGGACSDYQYLDLTLNAPTSATSYDSIFACGSYTWINGVTYTSSTSAPVDTLTSSTGQDSVVTLNLTINSPTTGTDIQTACNSYTWIDGVTYTSSNNSATYTLTNAAGCDSVVTLNLTISSIISGTDVITACDSYTWIDGNTYTASNNTATHTLTNAAGCDSVVTLNLTINSPATGTDIQTACNSYTWIDGVTYTSSNSSATYTLTNAAGCDSVVTLNLTINSPATGTDIQTACNSYTWIDGVTYTSSNNSATYTLTNAAGCDSVVTLNLTISSIISGTDVITACDSYTWIDGNTYTASNNTATHTLTNAAGCDSVVTLNLTINSPATGTDIQTACNSYTWIDGVTYTSSNSSATYTLTNAAGCDSVVTLNLTINSPATGTDIQTACNSYTWIDGVTYTSSNNSATYTLTNAAGCDSVVTLNLTINSPATGTDIQTACNSYTWIDGNTYTASNNTATHTLTNAAGCDSVVTLNLTINSPTTGTDIQTACNSYTWIDGNTYTSSNNSATYTLTNAASCDSVVTLNLTINSPATGTDIQTACNSYTWIDGNTYTSSNNSATYTLTNAAGCDSVVTLNLTINSPTTGTDIQTACNSYTWIDGNTYTSSNNSATYTLTNAAGCDSVVTLNLTINSPTTGTDIQTACNSYTWIDGVTYTSSNNSATYTLTNAAGCDSVVTLNLTINSPATGTDIQTACNSYTWIDGNTYTSSNNSATYTLTNAAGCDSVVTLNLTINSPATGTDIQTACNSYTWIDGNTYTASNNTATHTLTNAAGCDSVVTLNLTIESIDDSVVLSALTIYALPGYDSYQWYECTSNGYMMMSNETNDSISITANGDYAVVINNNNCSDTSDCVTVNNIGLREETQATFRIYPNPTQGKVKVERDNFSSPTGTYQLQLVDSRGKVTQISNVDFQDGFITINLENYPAGVYQITLINQHEVYHDKISLVK